MWILGLLALFAVVVYMYGIKNDIKVAKQGGCNTCPYAKQNPIDS